PAPGQDDGKRFVVRCKSWRNCGAHGAAVSLATHRDSHLGNPVRQTATMPRGPVPADPPRESPRDGSSALVGIRADDLTTVAGGEGLVDPKIRTRDDAIDAIRRIAVTPAHAVALGDVDRQILTRLVDLPGADRILDEAHRAVAEGEIAAAG